MCVCQSEGSRLQREMKSYMAAIKGNQRNSRSVLTLVLFNPQVATIGVVCVLSGMQQASINLTQSLHEVYEPDWHGKDDIVTIGKV